MTWFLWSYGICMLVTALVQIRGFMVMAEEDRFDVEPAFRTRALAVVHFLQATLLWPLVLVAAVLYDPNVLAEATVKLRRIELVTPPDAEYSRQCNEAVEFLEPTVEVLPYHAVPLGEALIRLGYNRILQETMRQGYSLDDARRHCRAVAIELSKGPTQREVDEAEKPDA